MIAMLKSPYFLIFFWLAGTHLLGELLRVKEEVLIDGEIKIRYKKWYAFLVFAPVIYMAATRGNIGDTYAYRVMYLYDIPKGLSAGIQYGLSMNKDRGFYVLSGILKAVFGQHFVWYFLVIALIQGICLVSVYRKYSDHYFISIFLFIASSDYISWMYNGIRQFTAVILIFAATDWLLQGKYIRYLLVVLLASTLHQSALLMIPFSLIAQGKAWNGRTLLYMAFALLAVLYVDQFTDYLNDALNDTQYQSIVSDWQEWQDDGTNLLRVLVYAVPTIMAALGYRIVYEEGNETINLCVNMSIISTGLYLISAFTSGIFIGRLPIYCSLYNYILLPWEIDHMFTKRSSSLVYILMVILYLLFYYYQMHISIDLI